jgi:hypothetical protein
VPVFNDKHLSTDFGKAQRMVAASKRLGFPFQAGSSLPLTWRLPAVEVPWGARVPEVVGVAYGGIDSYDFHVIEMTQCLSERRAGGEVGVAAVQAVRGPRVWELLRARPATARLFEAALARSHTLTAPAGQTIVEPTLDHAAATAKDPVAYFFEHRDGHRSSTFLLNGVTLDFTAAARLDGPDRILSTQFFLPMPPRQSTLADFFNPQIHFAEEMIQSGATPLPIERTLLTTGMLASAVDSLHRGGLRIETPELAVAYPAPKASTYWRA